MLGLSWFSLDAASPPPPRPPPASTARLPLYPLPAVYLPGSTLELRNIEPRNRAMCCEHDEFVASLVAPGGAKCARIGAILRIDDVSAAKRDSSGQVLVAQATTNVLQVRCTVVGRAEILACDNLDAWRSPDRDRYLMVDVANYDDEAGAAGDSSGDGGGDDDECHELTAEAPEALYGLVDALLEGSASDGIDTGGRSAAVEILELAADLAEGRKWWEALELWQRHCATRRAAHWAQHRADRDEFVVDAKIRQGGALQLPVREATLPEADRAGLADLDRRAEDAAVQMGLDDNEAFQACLQSRGPAQRARLLRDGARREADRLRRRALLARSFDSSSGEVEPLE